MTTPTEITLQVLIKRLESPMILREEIATGQINELPFVLSLSTSGSLIVEFGSTYYLLDNESFITACLEDFLKETKS